MSDNGGKAKMGRPLKFQDPVALQKQIDAFFVDCDKTGRPYTVTGLALALGTGREELLNYQDRPDFSDSIKDAKLKCHNYAEQQLYMGRNAVGPIFNLKNNYGWVDKSELEQSGKQTIRVERDLTDDELADLIARADSQTRPKD